MNRWGIKHSKGRETFPMTMQGWIYDPVHLSKCIDVVLSIVTIGEIMEGTYWYMEIVIFVKFFCEYKFTLKICVCVM